VSPFLPLLIFNSEGTPWNCCGALQFRSMLVFKCYDISRQAVRSIATPDIVPRHISSLQLPRTDSVCALISVDFFSVQPFFCTQNFGSEVQKNLDEYSYACRAARARAARQHRAQRISYIIKDQIALTLVSVSIHHHGVILAPQLASIRSYHHIRNKIACRHLQQFVIINNDQLVSEVLQRAGHFDTKSQLTKWLKRPANSHSLSTHYDS
jgi:hypothetical protein